MARIILIIAGLGFLGFGIATMLGPIELFQRVDMFFPDEALVRIELRAFYGGLEIGLGALLLAAMRKPEHVVPGLWLAAASYGAIGLARLTGIVLEGGYTTPFLIWASAYEIGLGGLALFAALKHRS